VLAASNLTGRGKHKKQQLDPLLIYGDYCHLRWRTLGSALQLSCFPGISTG
jgi:hypothetical protein